MRSTEAGREDIAIRSNQGWLSVTSGQAMATVKAMVYGIHLTRSKLTNLLVVERVGGEKSQEVEDHAALATERSLGAG